ncbi:hypothetical protein [Paenibacillus durus]|uniref:PAS fold-4 domain-containing protein n=1 Tax=Paenibacillus durus ATCC 35681 TaxID=1333534 RepID=A0A0F7F748_PAEDU|nr:hypothetical protein [Paenibacillus durus]AKG33657.1 hypothetical protein VK70_02865 [Paenibacillus durus ATCC 35681]
MSKSALSLAIRLIHSLPGISLAVDRHGLIAAANEPWKSFGIASGLSMRFEWTGTDYFEMMRELVLPPDSMLELTQAVHSIFSEERLVYSGRFPKPPSLKGRKWFQIEAFAIPEETKRSISFVLLSHRFISHAADPHQAKPPAHTLSRKPYHYLPICASCKSIRKDSEWIPVERFLEQELHTELTHDICPECIAQLYPQYPGALERLAD